MAFFVSLSLLYILFSLTISAFLYYELPAQVGKAITHAYSRATRSCPWTGDLWTRYLLALERGSASEKDIYAVSQLFKLKTKINILEGRDTCPTLIDPYYLALSISDALYYEILRKLR